MSMPGTESASDNSQIDRREEIVDLTADDDGNAPPIKKRKSAKQERLEREFKAYVASLDSSARIQVLRNFGKVMEEKDDIIRLREHYIQQPNSHEKHAAEINTLNRSLLYLDDVVFKIRTGRFKPSETVNLATDAHVHTKAVRGRIENIRQSRAIDQLKEASVDRSRNQLLNDPSYLESRSASMVTPSATTTNAMYRPDVTPETSNQQMLNRAFEDPWLPGELPDRTVVPSESREAYINGAYAAARPESHNTNLLPYSERANMLGLVGNEDDPSYSENIESQGYQSSTNYEELVDLALTEAEPLNMPPQMNCTPLEHQRQGLGWLVRAERGSNKGGILADDMGLGKTVQTIALFYANPPAPQPENSNNNRLVLIVCPVALIATWADELKNRVQQSHWLRVYIHHKGMNNGDFTTDSRAIEQNYDVVICTYHAVVNEYKNMIKMRSYEQQQRRDQWSRQFEGDDQSQNGSGRPRGTFPLFEIQWHRVVLDEAHSIKNRLSQMSLATSYLHSRFRLALTGTPMQNRIDELFPLVRFLKISPYFEWPEFKKIIPAEKSSTFDSFNAQKSLAAFLSAVMLRRKKDTVINGRKIIDNLPPKHVENVNRKMVDPAEFGDYEILEKGIRDEVNKISATEDITMSNMLVFLLRMRQAACHPYLIRITKKSASHKIWGNNKYTNAAINAAMTVNPEIRELALEAQDEERICADCDGEASSIADTHAMSGCGHVLCAECSIVAAESLGPEGSELYCPLCKVRYRSLANLEILDVLQTHRPQTAKVALELLLTQQRPRVERLRAEENLRKRNLEELTMNSNQQYDDLLLSSDSESFFGGSDHETDDELNEIAEESQIKDEDGNSVRSKSVETKTDDISKSVVNSVVDKDAPEEDKRGLSEHDPLEYKVDINEIAKLFRIPDIFTDGWRSSAKVDACLDALRSIWRESSDDKVIIFTSFTSLIDVFTIPLEAAQIPYAQYTGRMTVQERNATLDEFRRGRCKVLLASLKAGNVGLTLTQANRVIIAEPFWNPYVEEQAQDRVYRIGQSREVTVYRVRIEETVEDRIVTLQDSKRSIIESALDNGMKTRAQGLSRTDLMYALGLRRQPRSVASIMRAQREN